MARRRDHVLVESPMLTPIQVAVLIGVQHQFANPGIDHVGELNR